MSRDVSFVLNGRPPPPSDSTGGRCRRYHIHGVVAAVAGVAWSQPEPEKTTESGKKFKYGLLFTNPATRSTLQAWTQRMAQPPFPVNPARGAPAWPSPAVHALGVHPVRAAVPGGREPGARSARAPARPSPAVHALHYKKYSDHQKSLVKHT